MCIHRVVETPSVGPDSRISLIQSLKYILVLSFQRRQSSRVISLLEVLLPNAFLCICARWPSLLMLDVGFCPESPWSTSVFSEVLGKVEFGVVLNSAPCRAEEESESIASNILNRCSSFTPRTECNFLIPLKAGLAYDMIWTQWERQESLTAIEPRFPGPSCRNLFTVTLADISWLPKGAFYKTGFN